MRWLPRTTTALAPIFAVSRAPRTLVVTSPHTTGMWFGARPSMSWNISGTTTARAKKCINVRSAAVRPSVPTRTIRRRSAPPARRYMELKMGSYSFTSYAPPHETSQIQQRSQRQHKRRRHTEACDGRVCTTCGRCLCKARSTTSFFVGDSATYYCNDFCWARRPKEFR
jgi:hypothetical protein